MIIDQLPLYILCYVVGWAPLYLIYKKIELGLPFQLKPSKAIISVIPIIHLIYIIVEILRSYLIMFIVHQWLIYDADLIIGIALFLTGILWPIGISKQYRTNQWLLLTGLYIYLFPKIGWVVPLMLLLLKITGIKKVTIYSIICIFFTIIGVLSDANSLYIILYLFLFITILINCILDKNSSLFIPK